MDDSVVLDYYHTSLYPSEYEKTVKNGGYIKMPYLHSKGDSQPNLVYGGRKYKTEKLFIVKSSSPDYDGEMVIKHAPITNGDLPVYLIVPLKTMPTVYEETAVDKIIHQVNTSAFQFHLGEIIGYNTKSKVNEDGTVFVLSPLLVKSTFDNFLPFKEKEWSSKLKFREIALVFQGRPSSTKRMGGEGVEGFSAPVRSNKSKTSDAIYDLYDCEPIIENDGKIKPTIEVMPVTSELAKKVGTMGVMNATIHFFIFLIMAIIAGIITPLSYKTLFVDYISQLSIEAPKQAASLKMFSYIGTAVLLLFSLGISIHGMTLGDFIQSSLGAMMTIFIIISVSVMTYYRTIEPATYSFGDANADIMDSEFGKAFGNMIVLNKNYEKAFRLWGGLGVISILVYFFATFDKDKKKDKSKKYLMISYVAVFGLLFSFYFMTRI